MNNFKYVVKFENDKYYSIGGGFGKESNDLQNAVKYSFEWEPAKDMYLMVFLDKYPMKYELIKVRQYFEIVE